MLFAMCDLSPVTRAQLEFRAGAHHSIRIQSGKKRMKKRKRSAGRKPVAIDPEQLILDVASFYYEQRLTQEQIAKRIQTSRSTVSRMLEDARERGIVHIRINYPWQRNHELEERLVARFGLHEARVLVGKQRSEEEIRRGMGEFTARLIDSHVEDGQIFGVSYGRSLASTIAALAPSRKVALTVVPVIGALGSDNPSIDGPDLVRRFAAAYGGEYRYLPVPLLVEDVRTRDALAQLPKVHEILNLAKKADIVLIGIGALAAEVSSEIWKGYLDERQLQRLRNQGAVGHMCGQFYDARGKVLDLEVNRRSIGIGIQTLNIIENVIAVASGNAKTEAILGALRGQHLNILVTDDATAAAILNLEETAGDLR
jgi:deoxyribonucleoside regulator